MSTSRKEHIMAKRAAPGCGGIHKRTHTRNGKQYTYWEARITTGRDPLTGKQVQRTFSGKTQKEVREKMQAVAVEVNRGTYTPPCKMTVWEWLDIWQKDYLGGVKPATVSSYEYCIRLHIKPALGAARLDRIHPHTIQGFINALELAPQTVRHIWMVLHTALEKAVDLEYIPKNPADKCVLPKMDRVEIKPLDDGKAAALLTAANGTDLEHLVAVALFTGMRLSELLGLTWDSVDVERGTITVDKQLARPEHRAAGLFISPKSGKARTLTPAPSVMLELKAQRRRQYEMQLQVGPEWDNVHGLVFTSATGGPLKQKSVRYHFTRLTAAAGLEGVRFHDLRHTYAVNAIRAGDDIKTVQSNLGHATAAFTLDRYAHFTESMRQDSAARMEGFIKTVLER